MKRQLAAVISERWDSAPVTAGRTTEWTPSAPTTRSWTSDGVCPRSTRTRSPTGPTPSTVVPQRIRVATPSDPRMLIRSPRRRHTEGASGPQNPASSTANSSRPIRVRYPRRRIRRPREMTASARPSRLSARSALPGRLRPRPGDGGVDARSTTSHGTPCKPSARTRARPAIPPPTTRTSQLTLIPSECPGQAPILRLDRNRLPGS